MILAAHQTQYMPYPGIIDKIDKADIFIFQDDLQYVKQEYQNRNRIRTPGGWSWLTIPVSANSKSRICEVFPARADWFVRHGRVIRGFYGRSSYLQRLEGFWRAAEMVRDRSLAEINFATTMEILKVLAIEKPIFLESELHLSSEECANANSRLISLCKRLNCDVYLSGIGGKSYLDPDAWKDARIEVKWQTFCLREYRQQFPGWVPNMSVVDLLLCVREPMSHLRETSKEDSPIAQS